MAHFEVLQSIDLSEDRRFARGQGMIEERVTGLRCLGCKMGFAVVEELCHLNARPGSGEIVFRGVFMYPLPARQTSSDVPQNIADIYSEAVVALAAGIPRSASLMARATIEAITVDKGENPSHKLIQRIKNLVTRGELTPALGDWADQVRLLGNSGAHDINTPVDRADAKQLIDFIRELLRYLYELPAELTRRRGTP
jgi:hypothetical protein